MSEFASYCLFVHQQRNIKQADWKDDLLGFAQANPTLAGGIAGGGLGALTGIGSGNMLRNGLIGAGLGAGGGYLYNQLGGKSPTAALGGAIQSPVDSPAGGIQSPPAAPVENDTPEWLKPPGTSAAGTLPAADSKKTFAEESGIPKPGAPLAPPATTAKQDAEQDPLKRLLKPRTQREIGEEVRAKFVKERDARNKEFDALNLDPKNPEHKALIDAHLAEQDSKSKQLSPLESTLVNGINAADNGARAVGNVVNSGVNAVGSGAKAVGKAVRNAVGGVAGAGANTLGRILSVPGQAVNDISNKINASADAKAFEAAEQARKIQAYKAKTQHSAP